MQKKIIIKKWSISFLMILLIISMNACGNKTENEEKVEPVVKKESNVNNTDDTKKELQVEKENPYKLFSASLDEIDVYEIKRQPGKRNEKANWNRKIFYGLEDIDDKSEKDGKIKNYQLENKVFRNKESKNRMEYEVYKNPKDGKIAKIVSIEYREKDLEITDYYYTDKGEPNFIYQRKDSIYTPTYATPDKTGERFYFNKDSLIRWREINKPLQVHEKVLKLDKKSGATKQVLYKKLSKKDKKKYDKKELKMLNAAYNTYEAMLREREYASIYGHVTNSKGEAISEAKVEFFDGDNLIGEVKTDENGFYETGISVYPEGYTIKIIAEGYGEVILLKVKVSATGQSILMDKIVLVLESKEKKVIKLNIFDAEATKLKNKKFKRKLLSGAKILVRKGKENKEGEILAEVSSNEDGKVDLNLENGIYTIEIIMDDYVISYRTLIVEENKTENIPLIKKVKKNQMKVVVTWEGEADLDSYLFTPYKGEKGDMAYVGANIKEDEYGNKLTLDGKKGNTVEVITIEDITRGSYKYYISDYTKGKKKKFNSKSLRKLKLVVAVYDENGLVEIYTLPYEVNGTIWEVFEVKNGRIIPLQKTYSNTKGKAWWIEAKEVAEKNLKAHLAYEKYIKEIGKGESIFNGWKIKELLFAYHDMDNDMIDDLLLCEEYDNGESYSNYPSYYLFQYKKGKIKKVYDFLYSFENHSVVFSFDKNGIYEYVHLASSGGVEVSILKNGKIKKIYSGGYSLRDSNGEPLEEIKNEVYYTTKEYKRFLEDSTRIKFLPVNEKNLKKYRNTYNSTDFKEYRQYVNTRY